MRIGGFCVCIVRICTLLVCVRKASWSEQGEPSRAGVGGRAAAGCVGFALCVERRLCVGLRVGGAAGTCASPSFLAAVKDTSNWSSQGAAYSNWQPGQWRYGIQVLGVRVPKVEA